MRFLRNAGAVMLAAALVAGCGDSNDPTTFDPDGVSSDLAEAGAAFDAVFTGDVGDGFFLAGEFMATLTSPGMPVVRASSSMLQRSMGAMGSAEARQDLEKLAAALLASRTQVSGSAVILPPEVLGTTYEWDAETDTYVASDRTDGPTNGVRFVLYAINPATHQPAEPLNELGNVDLLDLSTASADIARLLVVVEGVTYYDYRLTLAGGESDGSFDVLGFITDGTQRVNFDLRNQFTSSLSSEQLALDYELEFPQLDLTLDYDIVFDDDATSSDTDITASLRSPHGYIDLTGTESSSEAGSTSSYLFEVNGDDFATVTCPTDANCTVVGADGNPLSAAEETALEDMYGFTFLGLLVALTLMTPVGAFFAF